jgi:hypothetical protein
MGRHRNDHYNGAANPQDNGALNGATADEGVAGEGVDMAESGESTENTEHDTTPDAANPQDNGAAGTDTGATVTPENKNGTGDSGASPPPSRTGKKRVRHPGGKATKVIAGSVLVEFDGEGVAELDTEQAEYLLDIPGYEEA